MQYVCAMLLPNTDANGRFVPAVLEWPFRYMEQQLINNRSLVVS